MGKFYTCTIVGSQTLVILVQTKHPSAIRVPSKGQKAKT